MENEILYLSQENVEATGLTMAQIIEVVEKGFNEMGNGRVEMPPKPGVHPGEGGITLFMPCQPIFLR